jgi:type II secretory pathway pseudopilin PulG
MRTRLAGKNLLFAELIVVILFFSLAAAACVSLFAQAKQDTNDARDLTNAVIMAQNAAEVFKATGGTTVPTFQENGLITRITAETTDTISRAFITVYRASDEGIVYELVVAVEVPNE